MGTTALRVSELAFIPHSVEGPPQKKLRQSKLRSLTIVEDIDDGIQIQGSGSQKSPVDLVSPITDCYTSVSNSQSQSGVSEEQTPYVRYLQKVCKGMEHEFDGSKVEQARTQDCLSNISYKLSRMLGDGCDLAVTRPCPLNSVVQWRMALPAATRSDVHKVSN
jgi:hypothetical protein